MKNSFDFTITTSIVSSYPNGVGCSTGNFVGSFKDNRRLIVGTAADPYGDCRISVNGDVDVKIVWEPAWSIECFSNEAKMMIEIF